MNIKFFQADAFTNEVFKGNPAAICLLDDPLTDDLMQKIAMENNLAETAFIVKAKDGFNLRWFTPTVEINLCGHATLASAHILWQEGILQPNEIANFHTKSGLLKASKLNDWIELDFPAAEITHSTLPEAIRDALNVIPLNTVFAKDRYIIELESEQDVAEVTPDFNILKNHDSVVITSRGGKDSVYDFVSRSFAPSHGINEDPVTGSSHCGLAPYWESKFHKKEFLAYQSSARGGVLKVRCSGDRVFMAGQAVTIISGTFHI